MKLSNGKAVSFLFVVFYLALQLNINTSDASISDQAVEVRYAKISPVEPYLVLHLPFLEGNGSNAFDLSGSENNGVISPNQSVTWVPKGGLSLNGVNNSITLNGSSVLQSAEKTVVLQFLWDGKGRASELYLYDDGWASNGSMIMYVHPATSRLYVEFMTNSGEHCTLWSSIIAGRIYMAAFRLDGIAYNLTVIDESSQEISESAKILDSWGILNSNLSIRIGASQAGTSRFFSGDIYDFRVYNCSIVGLELSQLYASLLNQQRINLGSTCVVSGLVAAINDLSLKIGGKRVYVNDTFFAISNEEGVFRFNINVPNKAGNYTFKITTDSIEENSFNLSLPVDAVKIADFGSTAANTGAAALAWFNLISEFDHKIVNDSVIIRLSNGFSPTWSSQLSRWEYKETRYDAGILTIHIDSLTWSKYGSISLDPESSSETITLQWTAQPWYRIVATWLFSIGLVEWGVIAIIVLLLFLILFKRIRIIGYKPASQQNEIRRQLNVFLQSSVTYHEKIKALQNIIDYLLEGDLTQNELESLQTFANELLKNPANNLSAEELITRKDRHVFYRIIKFNGKVIWKFKKRRNPNMRNNQHTYSRLRNGFIEILLGKEKKSVVNQALINYNNLSQFNPTNLTETLSKRPSDIWQHLTTLHMLTTEFNLQTVLELGTAEGESTIALLQAAQQVDGKVYSIDINPCMQARKLVGANKLLDRWSFIQGNDLHVDWKRSIDHLFIDTSHEFEHTLQELNKYEPFVRDGGIITLHDIVSFPEVLKAITLYANGRTNLRFYNYLHNNGLTVIFKGTKGAHF